MTQFRSQKEEWKIINWFDIALRTEFFKCLHNVFEKNRLTSYDREMSEKEDIPNPSLLKSDAEGTLS